MTKYHIKRATRAVGTEVQRGWVVEAFPARKKPGNDGIIYATKNETEREANRLALIENKRVKDLNA